jgi:hypothetical protein
MLTAVYRSTGRYEQEIAFNIKVGTFTQDGDFITCTWAKELKNSMETACGGAYGSPAQAWTVEVFDELRFQEITLGGDSVWLPRCEGSEDTKIVIADESQGYTGGTPLGKTHLLGIPVPCRGPAGLPADWMHVPLKVVLTLGATPQGSESFALTCRGLEGSEVCGFELDASSAVCELLKCITAQSKCEAGARLVVALPSTKVLRASDHGTSLRDLFKDEPLTQVA